MTKKIYKYIGPDILDIAFKKEGFCGLKFSYPKDYNDPYELFLTIDFENNPEVIAFYNEIIQEIPQHPTTCFSKSPIVTPMWAHYAHNSKGFVIEIDEEKLREYLGDASLDDVIYQDEPRSELSSTFEMAYRRGKPRDMMFLMNGVKSAAYFTKHSCWSYELERRLVVSDKDITTIDGNMILFIPTNCVTAIISGPRTKQDYRKCGIELCNKIDSNYLEAKIGRSRSQPYFLDKNTHTYIFDEKHIIPCNDFCLKCKEPVSENKKTCSWCSITDSDKSNAAFSNPLRAFAEAGILNDYIRDFNAIGKKKS